MKNILFILSVLTLALLLGACSAFKSAFDTQEVSFAGLKTYYINPPQSAANVSQLWSVRASFNEMVVASIEQELKQKGFERVAEKSQAQFYITPVYNQWTFNSSFQTSINNDTIMELGDNGNLSNYMTLELQAYLPNSENFVWRGFSDVKIFGNFISRALAENSVQWCLQTFPCETLPESAKKAEGGKPEMQKPAEQPKSTEPSKPEAKAEAEAQKAA